jgi:hypothetical protein
MINSGMEKFYFHNGWCETPHPTLHFKKRAYNYYIINLLKNL